MLVNEFGGVLENSEGCSCFWFRLFYLFLFFFVVCFNVVWRVKKKEEIRIKFGKLCLAPFG